RAAEAIVHYEKAVALRPDSAEACKGLVLCLVMHPDPKQRDPKRAVELAERAVRLDKGKNRFLGTLAAACYRAARYGDVLAPLKQSMSLNNGGDAFDGFLLAMTLHKLGQADEALGWYRKAVQWLERHPSQVDTDLHRFHAEARALLKVEK